MNAFSSGREPGATGGIRPATELAPGLFSRLPEVVQALTNEGWVALPRVLDRDFVRRLREESRGLFHRGDFRAAGVGRAAEFSVRPEIRSDCVRWIDPGAPTTGQALWLAIMEELRLGLNMHAFMGLFGYEAHLAVYPPGARYVRHRDHFAGTDARLLTTTLYLNEDWEPAHGGELRLFVPHGDGETIRDIAPEAGTLVLFLSQGFEHEVLPSTRERWSLTGWFTRRER